MFASRPQGGGNVSWRKDTDLFLFWVSHPSFLHGKHCQKTPSFCQHQIFLHAETQHPARVSWRATSEIWKVLRLVVNEKRLINQSGYVSHWFSKKFRQVVNHGPATCTRVGDQHWIAHIDFFVKYCNRIIFWLPMFPTDCARTQEAPKTLNCCRYCNWRWHSRRLDTQPLMVSAPSKNVEQSSCVETTAEKHLFAFGEVKSCRTVGLRTFCQNHLEAIWAESFV